MASGESYRGPERRASLRYKVSFHARWGGEWERRDGTVTNLSADGCFILTDESVVDVELVMVELEIPGGQVLTLWGGVIHRAENGFGVRFSPFTQGGAREALGALLRDLAAGG